MYCARERYGSMQSKACLMARWVVIIPWLLCASGWWNHKQTGTTLYCTTSLFTSFFFDGLPLTGDGCFVSCCHKRYIVTHSCAVRISSCLVIVLDLRVPSFLATGTVPSLPGRRIEAKFPACNFVYNTHTVRD